MRLEGLRIKGFGPFKDELVIDFARDYGDAKVIAITGENGAGKTTMLELALPGAMFRSTPTRGSLTELATTRDAMLEARVVNGKPWILRHLVDGVSKKSEAIVLNGDGLPVVESGKVTHFDQWAAKHLPAPEVLFTSVFGAQGADGFVGMKPGERKAVLLRTLGVERYEGLAERARDRAKQQKTKIETLDARISDERARHGGNAVPELEAAVDEQSALERQLEMARRDLADAEKEAAQSAEARRVAGEASARREQLTRDHATAVAAVADLKKRIGACREIMAAAEQIRGAVARISAIDADLARLATEGAERQAELAKAEAEHGAAREQLASARRERRTAEERAARLTERLADEGKVARAAAGLEAQRGAVDAARAAVQVAETALAELQGQRLAGAAERIVGLRKGLSDISAAETDSDDSRVMGLIANNALDDDDAAVTLATELPRRQRAAEGEVRTAKVTLVARERELADAERVAARASELAAARAELAEAKSAIEDAINRETAADQRITLAHNVCEPLRLALAPLGGQGDELRAERAQIEQLAGKVDLLTKAETLCPERETQLTAAQADLGYLTDQISATPEPAIPKPAPDVAAYRNAAEGAEKALRTAAAAVAVAAQRCEQERASAERLVELSTERAGLDDELADWSRLAADLGRDGLQAQLIDAAIPELNHVSNELLHEAFGPRFTIDIRTQALDSKGKRLLETLDVVVIDTVGGREALAETFSGGERVILQEALSLGLTVLACRQSGMEQPTLIRDESGAALSAGKAAQWVAMLRRAVDLIGAKQCLFVSHTPATWELADARIHLGAPEVS